MQNSKTILVTGATGNQGSAAVKTLLDNGFSVKAITRDPSSAAAQNLKNLNATVVQADLNNNSSYRDQLKDVDGIFCVLTFVNGTEKEINQGISLVNLAKEYGVKHFIYSSVIGADLGTGIPHWESKSRIEDHLKASGLPYTIIRPVSFYENFLLPQVKSRILKGKLASPVKKEVMQQFISARDVGKTSAEIFMNPGRYLNRTITMAAEEMDMKAVASVFSEAMGKEINYQNLPMFITRLIMGKRLHTMFKWLNEHDAVFVKDLQAFKKEYPNLTALKDWIKLNFKTT
ncbi:MAG TPA: NmrA/HSCARG family protein [Ferruginibacter sp.]|nr:NmrA/HSCARG family protein [Ferruginibacter sp.]